MSYKQAAEELLKIADSIEKEAEEVTQFVCDKCNHTATLATVNNMRREAAEGAEENVTVNPVTVNDSLQCPACDGKMAYVPSEDSQSYYFDPEQKEATEEKEASEEQDGPIDYDSLERYSA